MSKFINTEHKNTIDSLVEGVKSKLNNPYYLYTDQKATVVDYYNSNTTKSTLDEGSGLQYDNIGGDSPIRFNIITDTYLFGLDKINTNLDNGEYGLESDTIEGEAIVVPNTFIPIPGDYFVIKHISEPLLFKVISTSFDTLDNGSNLYKISYRLAHNSISKLNELNNQVVSRYKMIVGNIGTNFSAIIRENDFNLISEFESISETLKTYYTNLFFDRKVQTFIMEYDNVKMYDPYLIEFLIRNHIFGDGDNYMHIMHQTCLPHTFSLNYDSTFFRSVEMRDPNNISKNINSEAYVIHDQNSLMSRRSEDYYQIEYGVRNSFNGIINNFRQDVMDAIKTKSYFPKGSEDELFNIYIDYFYNINFDSITIETLEKINMYPNITVFYAIPLIIYMIDRYVENLMR